MTDLLKATTSPPSTVERSSRAEAQVSSLDLVDGAWVASPITETATEVADTILKMSMGPPITELLPESGIETTSPPTMGDVRLPSLPSLKRVDTTEHSQTVEGAREASDVGSQGTSAPQSQDPSLGWTITGPELG